MGGQWMMKTQKNVPERILKMSKIVRILTLIYHEITDVLEELLCKCYLMMLNQL